MPTPLVSSVFARLDRADEQIRDLDREITAFRKQYPDASVSYLDPDTGNFSHKISQVALPMRFSVIAGEILFLIRSSLDHLIAYKLIPITNPADIDAVLERSEFPIYTKPISWQSYDWTKIPGVSPQVRAAITTCQPCNRTDGLPIEDHPLAVLQRMNNIDKHRLLLVLVNKTSVSSFTLIPRGNVRINGLSFTPTVTTGSSGVEAELITGTVSGGDVDVDVQKTVDVAFKQVGTRQGEPVIPTLEHLLMYVRELSDRIMRLP